MGRNYLLIVSIATLLVGVIGLGDYQYNIPNGFFVPCPPGACIGYCAGVGHLNNDQVSPGCAGGEHPYHYNNQFGLDLQDYGTFNWNHAVCIKDSDRDGQTNGDELGDPCCRWSKENPTPLRPKGSVSHPGFATAKVPFKSCLLDGAPTVQFKAEYLTQTSATVHLDFNNTCTCDTDFEFRTDTSSPFQPIDTLVQTGYNFTLTALEPNTTYYFRVTSANLNGSVQIEYDVTTEPLDPDALVPPSAITLVSATATSIFVTWPAVTGATNYQLDAASNGSMFSTIYMGPDTNFQLTNLSNSRTYQFRIRSMNADGVGLPTSTFNFSTLASGGNTNNTADGNSVVSQGYSVTMGTDDPIRAGTTTTLTFSVTDPTGVELAYNSLTLNRMRRMHVFILSMDLDIIGRVAPEDFSRPNLLSYSVDWKFKRQGAHVVMVLFSHNGNNVTVQFNLPVSADLSGGAPSVKTRQTNFDKNYVMMGNTLTAADTYTVGYDISVEDMTELADNTIMPGSINITIFGAESLGSEECSQLWFQCQNPRQIMTTDMTSFLGNAFQFLIFDDNMTYFDFVAGNAVTSLTAPSTCDAPTAPASTFGPYLNLAYEFPHGGKFWLVPFFVQDNDLFYLARFPVNVTDNSLTPLTSGPIKDGDFDYHVSVLAGTMDIYWSVHKNLITFGISAKSNGWLGIGFNPAGSSGMIDTDMIMGWVDDSSGPVVNDYYSTAEVAPTLDTDLQNDNDRKRHGTGKNNIMEFNGSRIDGVTTLKFRRLLDTGDKFDSPLVPGLTTLVYAFNPTTSRLVTHDSNRGSAQLDLFTGSVDSIDSGAELLEAMRLAHAVLMTLGWMIFVPAGIIIAKFFHHYKWWFPVHIAVMTVAVAMIIIAFVISIVMTNTDFLQADLVARSHSWLGLIVVILAVAQPILGYIADRMWDPNRSHVPWFPDKLHWYFGRYSAVGAYANVILGMIYLNVWYGYWILLGILIFLQIVGVHFLMQAHKKMKGNESTDGVEMGSTKKSASSSALVQ